MSAPTDHRSNLRAELVAAAARQRPRPQRRPNAARRAPRLLTAAASIAVVAAVAVMVLTVVGADPASAKVFHVVVRDGMAIVKVEDAVEHPDDAAAELREIGLDVKMVDSPVPPWLEGAVVAMTMEADTVDVETDGVRVTEFRIPVTHTTPVSIFYGRPARPGELYTASDSVPDCGDYALRTVTPELVEEISRRWGPVMRWQEWPGGTAREHPVEELHPDAVIVDIVPLSSESVITWVSDGSPPPPEVVC